MRLQGGLLHVVGWRGREHLVYMRATFRGGRRCARNSLSPIPPLVEAQGRPRVVFTPSLSPHFLWQLQSHSIEVSRCPGCCFHTKWLAGAHKSPGH